MRFLPTVLLRHETGADCHYDWMMGDPGAPAGQLWTGRTRYPSRFWSLLPGWDVEAIGAHRRDYLTYEGLLSGGRGSVIRVDQGTIRPRQWTDQRIVLDLRMSACCGLIEMDRVAEMVWRAHVCRPSPAHNLSCLRRRKNKGI